MISNWQLIPLAEMASFSRGVSWRKEEESKNGEGIAVLSIPNIGRGRLNFDAKHRLKKLPNPSKLVAVGDVLFVGSSGSIDNIARNARVTILPTEPVAFASFTFKATPRQAICDPTFFYFLMNSALPAFTDFARRAADGKFNFQLTSFVERSAFRIPPLNEQRQIAAALSAVQRVIERQERLIALTTELKKALIHKLVTEGTRGEPLRQTEIGLIPCSWQAAKLADAVDYIDYGISAPIPKRVPPDGAKIVSTADITKDGEIIYEKIRRIVAPARTVQRLTLKHGDVLFNWRNSSELIGKSAVFKEQSELHVFASFILRIRCDEMRSHNVFLSCLMNYYREQGIFVKLSRRAVNQANYNRNEISVLGIPLPPIDEQLEIARTITSVVNAHNIQVRRLGALQGLLGSLLHQLMTGLIRVHDLDLSALEEAEQEAVGAV